MDDGLRELILFPKTTVDDVSRSAVKFVEFEGARVAYLSAQGACGPERYTIPGIVRTEPYAADGRKAVKVEPISDEEFRRRLVAGHFAGQMVEFW